MLTSSNLQVAFTRTMAAGRSTWLSCSRKHTRSAALLEGAHTKMRLSGKAWYTCDQGTRDKGTCQLCAPTQSGKSGACPHQLAVWAPHA